MALRLPAVERSEVLLVCSSGGHLLQLTTLTRDWDELRPLWVTFDKSDARSLLPQERTVFAHGPTNRNLPNLARNLVLAWRVVRRVRPKLVVTTGAGVAVPFCWLARMVGARIVYVESITRINEPSLSLRLIAPIAQRVYVQWPELARSVRGARYVGNLFGAR